MLFKLSVSNIRRSLRDYAIYFFTLIIGVSVFYVFNAIGEQTAFLKISENTSSMIELLDTMLSGVSVFVSFILGLLIVYASRFLMKRRNKEFALYLILGMGKSKISAILLIETIIIGCGSLLVGLAVGVGLSQLMSSLVANLFEADMTEYKFLISGKAIAKTAVYFGIMYLVVMVFNSIMIGKLKLISLMQSGKKSEKLKLKNPALCIVIFLASVSALGYAYYKVGWDTTHLSQELMAKMIATGAIATFLIFWSVSGMLLRVVMSMKKTYFSGLNSFTFRQISSKVNTTVASMTVICLMLFVTICTLSSAFSIRNSMNANIASQCPADFELYYTEHENDGLKYTDITEKYKTYGYDITEDFSEYVHFHSYLDDNFVFRDSLGEYVDVISEQYPFLDMTSQEIIVKLSDYNKLMQLYDRDTFSLGEDEFIIVCDFASIKKIRDDSIEVGTELNIMGKTLRSKYADCQDGFIDISSQHINSGIFIVPDSAVDEAFAGADYFIGNYPDGTRDDKSATEKTVVDKYDNMLRAWRETIPKNKYSIGLNTKITIAEATIGLGAIVTFLGLYIGLIFLISCSVIIALKQLSDTVDSMQKYEILRKIGAEEKDISKSLFRQTGIFFLLPLVLACVHSVFGMKFSKIVLEALGTEKMTESIIFSSAIILLIYGGYFLITYLCSKSIIREHK
ncbi:MAG: ABC transporter permease [Ruminococcus sp.]|nr:ABC transporter permease [Ruminococcus sp.]